MEVFAQSERSVTANIQFLLAACAATFDFSAEQATKSRAENGADGAITAAVDLTADQRAASGTDDEARRAVTTFAVVTSVTALPHTVPTTNLTRFVIAAVVVIIAVCPAVVTVMIAAIAAITSTTALVTAIVMIFAGITAIVIIMVAVGRSPGGRSALRHGGGGGNGQRSGRGDSEDCLVHGILPFRLDQQLLCQRRLSFMFPQRKMNKTWLTEILVEPLSGCAKRNLISPKCG